SNYNALVAEVQKRWSNGLQFQGGYTWSKLMDTSSELFQGETTQGAYSQPYYYISNVGVRQLQYGRGAFDHTHSFKLNASYELPFLRDQRGILGKIAGGWQLSSFLQVYSGHPLKVYNSRTRFRGNARDANGIPENLGGDYNLDGVANDSVNYVGGSATA